MTEDNRRANTADELALAAEDLQVAETLLGLGFQRQAISHTYYAVFYLVRALLFARGLQAKTHAGVGHLFNIEFVLTGAFDSSHNARLTKLQQLREAADYDAKSVITAETVRDQLAQAHAFDTLVRDWLAANGWT